jgi:hypothetical protein
MGEFFFGFRPGFDTVTMEPLYLCIASPEAYSMLFAAVENQLQW